MTTLSSTERSTIRRGAARAVTDTEALHELLDASLLLHLGFVSDGAPVVLPTCFARVGERLYLHGSTGAASLRRAAERVEVCATVTVLDGIVYARSVFHHSANYRSAVIHGVASQLSDPEAKLTALHAVTEHLAPGSWEHTRLPSKQELAKTAVLALPLAEAAVKIRTGGPVDDETDIEADHSWAGVLPVHSRWGNPIPSPDLATPRAVPEHISRRRFAG
ncbi:MAG: pyridoxamine 5'-phosphate oxidase family protein [Sciscionella sp.]